MLWVIIYNFILFPFFFILIIFLSFFSKKIREGVYGRLNSKKIINEFISKSKNKDIYWFHAASLGEYEQIKPVLSALKEVEPDSLFVLSFFSPSGFNFVEDEDVDCKIYLPFDFRWTVKNYLKRLKPRKLILAGYDVWPNLIWAAKELNIHTVLFAARFSNICIPSGLLRLRTMLSLLVFRFRKVALLEASRPGPSRRRRSPCGGSILMTLAPSSDNSLPATAPALQPSAISIASIPSMHPILFTYGCPFY